MAHHEDRDAKRFDDEGNTRPKGSNFITTDASDDGVDRRAAFSSAWHGRAPNQIGIDNFNFTPPTLTVSAGTEISWINNDDVPHLM